MTWFPLNKTWGGGGGLLATRPQASLSTSFSFPFSISAIKWLLQSLSLTKGSLLLAVKTHEALSSQGCVQCVAVGNGRDPAPSSRVPGWRARLTCQEQVARGMAAVSAGRRRQVCDAYVWAAVVTWQLHGRLRHKQTKCSLMASYLESTLSGGLEMGGGQRERREW